MEEVRVDAALTSVRLNCHVHGSLLFQVSAISFIFYVSNTGEPSFQFMGPEHYLPH